jgi:hypothetical protein
LAKFWRSAREEWRYQAADSRYASIDSVVDYMSFDASPRYFAQVDEERTAFEADFQPPRAAQSLEPSDSHILQTVWGEEPETGKPVRSKAKPIHAAKVH